MSELIFNEQLTGCLYKSLDTVLRERAGNIMVCTRDTALEGRAKGSEMTVAITRPNQVADLEYGKDNPDMQSTTVDNIGVILEFSKVATFTLTNREYQQLQDGNGGDPIIMDSMKQCFRTLINYMNVSVYNALNSGGGLAYGNPATRLFLSDIEPINEVYNIMEEQGTPDSDRRITLASRDHTDLLNLDFMRDVNTSGSTGVLRDASLGVISGYDLTRSGSKTFHTKGDAAAYQVNNAALVVGDTTIAVDTGTGSFKAGDVVQFAGDSNKYIVSADLAGVGNLEINKPGLLVAAPDDALVTVLDSHNSSFAIDGNGLILATSLPEKPPQQDGRIDDLIMQDELTGLGFEVSYWGGNRQNTYQVALNWGVKVIKPEMVVKMLGSL